MKHAVAFSNSIDIIYKVYGDNTVKIYHEQEFNELDTSDIKFAGDLGRSEARLMSMIAEIKSQEKKGKSPTEEQKERLEKQTARVNKLRAKYHSTPWSEEDEDYILYF